MPKLPPDYAKNVIYGIFSNEDNRCVYIGHTTHFAKRKSQHKAGCTKDDKIKYNYKLYQSIREYGGWNNFTMKLIEEYPCKTMQEAITREFFNFQIFNPSFNTCVPCRKRSEYNEANKEKINEQQKQYREKNKEKKKEYYRENRDEINQRLKQYREANKEVLNNQRKQYTEFKKEKINNQRKQYREANKDGIADKSKQYREANKEVINNRRRIRYAELKALKATTTTAATTNT